MKKCSKYFLLISLLFIPTLVFASSGDALISIDGAIGIEISFSTLMSFFVFMPISYLFTIDDSKKLFWKLFVARIVILIFCYFFITTVVALVDLILLIIGTFVLVPILMLITKKDPYSMFAGDFLANYSRFALIFNGDDKLFEASINRELIKAGIEKC